MSPSREEILANTTQPSAEASPDAQPASPTVLPPDAQPALPAGYLKERLDLLGEKVNAVLTSLGVVTGQETPSAEGIESKPESKPEGTSKPQSEPQSGQPPEATADQAPDPTPALKNTTQTTASLPLQQPTAGEGVEQLEPAEQTENTQPASTLEQFMAQLPQGELYAPAGQSIYGMSPEQVMQYGEQLLAEGKVQEASAVQQAYLKSLSNLEAYAAQYTAQQGEAEAVVTQQLQAAALEVAEAEAKAWDEVETRWLTEFPELAPHLGLIRDYLAHQLSGEGMDVGKMGAGGLPGDGMNPVFQKDWLLRGLAQPGGKDLAIYEALKDLGLLETLSMEAAQTSEPEGATDASFNTLNKGSAGIEDPEGRGQGQSKPSGSSGASTAKPASASRINLPEGSSRLYKVQQNSETGAPYTPAQLAKMSQAEFNALPENVYQRYLWGG